MRNKYSAYAVAIFFAIFLTPFAGFGADLKLSAGGTLTFLPIPLVGVKLGAGVVGGGTTQYFYETELSYHYLRGGSSSSEEDGDSGGSVTFEGVELEAFVLFGTRQSFYWGPGVGYGIATVEESPARSDSVNKDPSPFFSSSDIHYGSGLLKFGSFKQGLVYEFIVSSFGGLLGGTLSCGFLF